MSSGSRSRRARLLEFLLCVVKRFGFEAEGRGRPLVRDEEELELELLERRELSVEVKASVVEEEISL